MTRDVKTERRTPLPDVKIKVAGKKDAPIVVKWRDSFYKEYKDGKYYKWSTFGKYRSIEVAMKAVAEWVRKHKIIEPMFDFKILDTRSRPNDR